MEGFKDIPGYEGLYAVSMNGEVLSYRRGKIQGKLLKIYLSNYKYVKLYKYDIKSHKTIHRLVATTYIKNDYPNTRILVNHKDGNKLNNHVSNLEWCTASENNFHASKIGLTSKTRKGRELIQMNLDGTFIAHYRTTLDAEKATGIHNATISGWCLGKRNCKKFKWKYL